MKSENIHSAFYSFLLGIILLCGSCKDQVTMDSLISEMATREHLSYFPSIQYSLRQFSSYNRESIDSTKEGWFANDDMSHFVRIDSINRRREFVMFDTTGPGAIVRWWMTFYTAQQGIIRVYLDNDSMPAIQGSANQVLSGTILTEPPFALSVHKGVPILIKGRDLDHNFYLPIPFAKHCKITYQCDSLSLYKPGYYFPDVFYNIDYRAYQEGVNVKTFAMSWLQKSKPALEKAKSELSGSPDRFSTEKKLEEELAPGETCSVEFNQDKSSVSRIVFELTEGDSLQALRSTVISAIFDGVQTIWAPVGDFFGTGYKLYPHKTWMNETSKNGEMISSWTMPFQKTCKLSFTNYGKHNIKIRAKVGLTSYKWNSTSMYFGACWHEYYQVNTRTTDDKKIDLNFVNIKGKGVYVGDEICLFNTSYEWWGEGDEKIFVDGETFPSSFGTGTEDYYGYAFGRPQPFSHPFISQPVGDGNEGNSNKGGLTINMRHRSLDAIPFQNSISSNIELWHWAKTKVNYSLTSYFYVQVPFELNIKPDEKSVQNRVARFTRDFEKTND